MICDPWLGTEVFMTVFVCGVVCGALVVVALYEKVKSLTVTSSTSVDNVPKV